MPARETIKPERFGRYVLLDRIGMGGMAEVFRAVMPGAEGFRRTLVLKRILAQFSGAASFVEMFVQEAQICSLLNHPNIVAVYDFGQIEGSYFLAMEYLRGRNLQALMRKLRTAGQVLPVPIAAHIAREVTSGLAYAHELAGPDGSPLNIVHRDVSPSNIMCLTTGGVKLLDFGIAKALGGATPEDRKESGAFKGKLAYTAPERIRQEAVDGRADIFSLGVVLWEMLTGRRLFRGTTDVETVQNLMEAPIPPPSASHREVPTALDAIVLRALARDPERRYQTGQEMADDLEGVVAETRYHSKMLPALLRQTFGADLKTGPMALEGLEEELAAAADGSISRGSKPSLPAAEVAPPPGDERRGPSWRRMLVGGASVVGVMSLAAAILFGRPAAVSQERRPSGFVVSGAARLRENVPAPALPAVAAEAETAPELAAPSVAGARAVAQPARALPIASNDSRGARKNSDAPSARSVAKSVRRARIETDRDRIARGLSIDPFSEMGERK